MDLSKLTPDDGVVALRSFERRYRSLFAEADEDETPDQLAVRPATGGWTILEHIVAAARDIAAMTRGLQAVQVQDDPLLDPAQSSLRARTKPQHPGGTVHERLAELGLEAAALAEVASQIAPRNWERTGTPTDGSGPVTAMDLLRNAVDAGAGHLRAATAVLAEVRSDND